ncbi:hypothetical protein ACWEOZ_42285 [Actinoplanes sp. NPDC004185]
MRGAWAGRPVLRIAAACDIVARAGGERRARDDAEELMDDALLAYDAGRVDALAGHRDAARAKDPETGPDYRRGFLDGRIEIFRMFAGVREILDES